MVGGPNELDYSNLNKSLHTKNGLLEIKNDTVEAIGKLLLQSNSLDVKDNMSSRVVKRRNESMDKFANSIEGASDGMKSNFIITVNYLINNKLLGSGKIKSLRIANLEKESISEDKKLENILNELIKDMPESDKLKLDKYVSMKLLDLSKESLKFSELGKQIDDLQKENKDLEDELRASDMIKNIGLQRSLSRWSIHNANRIGYSIKNIRENKSLDKEKKARKILLTANSYIIFSTGKGVNFGRILPYRKFDVNKEYTKVIDKLNKKVEKATDNEKLAIMFIIDEVDKAHKEYLEATNISEEEKKENKKRIIGKMAA